MAAGETGTGGGEQFAAAFDDLPEVDLLIDAAYPDGSHGHAGDDPVAELVPGVGNRGGFRYRGSPSSGMCGSGSIGGSAGTRRRPPRGVREASSQSLETRCRREAAWLSPMSAPTASATG